MHVRHRMTTSLVAAITLILLAATGSSGCSRTGLAKAPPDEAPPKGQPAAPLAASTARSGDYCGDAGDTACAWDFYCFPQACIASDKVDQAIKCSEVMPPPGTCGCVEGYCTTKLDDPAKGASTKGSCKTDLDCSVDRPTGKCVVGKVDYQPAIKVQGPACECNAKTGTCELQWYEPVPCETFADCWYDTSPTLHPVKSKKKRTKPVDPCNDGEMDSKCVDGVCTIVKWKC